jgi:hypothetical protein
MDTTFEEISNTQKHKVHPSSNGGTKIDNEGE